MMSKNSPSKATPPDELTPARVLVTGSVGWTDRTAIEDALDLYSARQRATGGSFRVITGMADGADEIARTWAEANGVHLIADPLEPGDYPAPMHRYNEKMSGWSPELVLAFKDPFDFEWASPLCIAGTEHMCRIAARDGIPVLLNGATWLRAPLNDARENGNTGRMHQTRWGQTLISIVQGDITTTEVDVIVNAANSSLLGGGGVDGAIHRAAGPDLLASCRDVVARQGGCPTGEAVITEAGNLPAGHVVHTVGPVWTGDKPETHDALLDRCYAESLRLANEAGAATIAFPNISTGVYRFPLDRAATVSLNAVQQWLETNDHELLEVVFVCFNEQNFNIYTDLISRS